MFKPIKIKTSHLTLIVGCIAAITVVKIILVLVTSPPLSLPEIESAIVARSIPYMISAQEGVVFNTIKSLGYTQFPLQLVLLLPFLKAGPGVIRLPGIILAALTSLVLSYTYYEQFAKKSSSLLAGILLTTLSPWLLILSLYHLPEMTTLFLFSFVIYLFANKQYKKKSRMVLILILAFLMALSSWSGLIAALTLPIITLVVLALDGVIRSKNTVILIVLSILIVYLPILAITSYNKDYVISKLNTTYLPRNTPSYLAEQINERQKIDFLSTNKKLILPPMVRKAVYNKPSWAVQEGLNQAVSFLDFEQYAFVYQSYDILKLSGIPPKGNPPLGFFWEIPLIIAGAYLILKRGKLKAWHLLILSAILGTITFFKSSLVASGSLLLPFIFFTVIVSVYYLGPPIKNTSKVARSLILIAFSLLVVISTLNTYYLVFFDQSRYRMSHPYYFRQLSNTAKSQLDNYESIVITNRLGPTSMAAAYYLDIDPKSYWDSRLNPESLNNDIAINLGKMQFRPIKFPEEIKSQDILYLGFPGEFVGAGKNLSKKPLPEGARLLNKIDAPDELVFNYGESIWVISF